MWMVQKDFLSIFFPFAVYNRTCNVTCSHAFKQFSSVESNKAISYVSKTIPLPSVHRMYACTGDTIHSCQLSRKNVL